MKKKLVMNISYSYFVAAHRTKSHVEKKDVLGRKHSSLHPVLALQHLQRQALTGIGQGGFW